MNHEAKASPKCCRDTLHDLQDVKTKTRAFGYVSLCGRLCHKRDLEVLFGRVPRHLAVGTSDAGSPRGTHALHVFEAAQDRRQAVPADVDDRRGVDRSWCCPQMSGFLLLRLAYPI